jgi:predicted amidophosphoribosyltransferase
MRPVILLDDIYTTGATVRAAAQALQQQGIPVWGVVAIAKTISDRPAHLS